MSRYSDHLHVSYDPAFHSQRRHRPSSPYDTDDGLEHFTFPTSSSTASATTMPTIEEQLAAFQQLAAAQQKQIEEANQFARQQQQQLEESRAQLQQSQQTVDQLSNAFQNMATTMETNQNNPPPAPHPHPHRKKPELPPFDPANISIWIRRVTAAYDRAGVVIAKDKFAYLESMFQVKMNPRIDAFMYGSNTEQDWSNFLTYLVEEYGPTIRQKTVKLLSDNPRHDMRPSQYLVQLKEDCKGVEIDHIYREHLLKSIPPRIREIMGKDVDKMTSEEVALAADDYFDRKGKPIEKVAQPISHVTKPSPPASNEFTPAFAPSFTPAFEEADETDINAVKKGNRGRGSGQGGNRQRSQSRNWRDKSNSASNSSNSASSSSTSGKAASDSTCYFHRRWGDKTTKCVTNCSLYSKFIAQNRQTGNGQGGRRQ